MIVFVISLVLLAIIFITCTLITLINGSGAWVRRFLVGFIVFIFAALSSLVFMFIKQ